MNPDDRVLVTGAAGSIGSELVRTLDLGTNFAWSTDRDTLDVTILSEVREAMRTLRPAVVFHLAGAKHAPQGEEDPFEAARINITGTGNVLEASQEIGARVVTASTCKACNPETAYGATKLIAERMTLNAGGSVARFYNVRETCGNVFEIWRNLPADQPLPVTPCRRRFMGIEDAVQLLLFAAQLPSGRYSVAGTESVAMIDIAAELYPGRPIVWIPPRRGDRLEEPERATHEVAVPATGAAGIDRIASFHDLLAVPEPVAA